MGLLCEFISFYSILDTLRNRKVNFLDTKNVLKCSKSFST